MIKAIIVDNETSFTQRLKKIAESYGLNINFCGVYKSLLKSEQYLKDIELVFYNSEFIDKEEAETIFPFEYRNFEVVCFGKYEQDAYKAYKANAFDFLLQPLEKTELCRVVKRINKKQQIKKQSISSNPVSNILGIPTITGFDFISIKDIIRCEGMQSYTRICMRNSPDIISSNNIGEIKKRLGSQGFFSPHKSFIINLNDIVSYSKEGVILLKDGSQVPLARRRKSFFFELISVI